jgi:hypothetical protein
MPIILRGSPRLVNSQPSTRTAVRVSVRAETPGGVVQDASVRGLPPPLGWVEKGVLTLLGLGCYWFWLTLMPWLFTRLQAAVAP